MRKALSLVLVIVSAVGSQMALAGFDDVEAKAKAYRDSGQLAKAEKAEEIARERAAIPAENRHYIKLVANFAQKLGGISSRSITYDNEGSVDSIEFTTRGKMSCKVRYADMRCVDLNTMTEYYYLTVAPEGWSYGIKVR